jgi:hypothetical protein
MDWFGLVSAQNADAPELHGDERTRNRNIRVDVARLIGRQGQRGPLEGSQTDILEFSSPGIAETALAARVNHCASSRHG